MKNMEDLERIQKIVLKVILTDRYTTYVDAFSILKVDTLENRHKTLCLHFPLKCLRNQHHRGLFKEKTSPYHNHRNLKKFEEPHCHTKRYKMSPVPYITRLLNEHYDNQALAEPDDNSWLFF